MAGTSQDEPVSNQEDIKFWVLGRKGINMIINDENYEAEMLFQKYPDTLVMFAGYSFTVFMDALMSFEEQKLNRAISTLKEVEKRCTTQSGWLKSISIKVFGNSTNQNGTNDAQTYVDQLETQIILADSQVCIAILTFLQQDLSGYFKGGWVLRKAWKVYQRTYKEILQLYKDRIGELQLPDPAPTPLTPTKLNDDERASFANDLAWNIPDSASNGYSKNTLTTPQNSHQTNGSSFPHSHSLNNFESCDTMRNNSNNFVDSADFCDLTNTSQKRPNCLALMKKSSSFYPKETRFTRKLSFGSLKHSLTSSNWTKSINRFLEDELPNFSMSAEKIDKKTIVRLMGAISFGYGLFQLGVSLLPPNLARLVSLLGFAANRQNGISCLMYARLGEDMRAPLASLALLWYHTIVRPFYAIDGTNVQAGVDASWSILRESEKEFPKSALFLFFKGRACRLQSDIPQAIACFNESTQNAKQREIKLLSLHEVGWCHLISLNYIEAMTAFVYLKCQSRWSKAFYAYLSAICTGAAQDFQHFDLFDDLQSCIASSPGGQLDEFLNRRKACCPPNAEAAKKLKSVFWRLLAFELLYLWNALASCSVDRIDQIINDCMTVGTQKDEPRKGLALLILGNAYNVQNKYSNAVRSFRECLEVRKNEAPNANDAHISAFAQFELGHLLIEREATKAEGKLFLQQINRYSRYDFEGRLVVRVHATLKNL